MIRSKVVPFSPDRNLKLSSIQHVVYEYANLMAAAYYSIHGQAPWRTHCDDAFLLGCRKLGDFLLNRKRYKKDVLAVDFLPSQTIRLNLL